MAVQATAVVMDLTHTVYWGSAGIREVVHAYRLAKSMGVDLRIVMSAIPDVNRRWTMRGLDQLIGFYPNLAAAIEGSRQHVARRPSPHGDLGRTLGEARQQRQVTRFL
jgi:anti-anti-sigma regulatory factor